MKKCKSNSVSVASLSERDTRKKAYLAIRNARNEVHFQTMTLLKINNDVSFLICRYTYIGIYVLSCVVHTKFTFTAMGQEGFPLPMTKEFRFTNTKLVFAQV